MSSLFYLVKIAIVEKVIAFVFQKVRANVGGYYKQVVLLLLLFLLYFHGYFYVFIAGEPTLYQTIGVNHRSSTFDIKRRSKELLKQYHPDRNPENAKAFMQFEEIFSVLNNENERWMYDRFNLKIEVLRKYR
jgi:hypothetical protein